MIRTFTIIPALFGITALIISACSSGGGGNSGSSENLVGPITDLQGIWTTGCRGNGPYSKETLVFSGSSFTTQEINYYDSACENEEWKTNVTGSSVSVGDLFIFDDNTAGYQFSFKLQTIEYMPLSEDDVQFLNEETYCGVENWQKNVAVDLINKDCSNITKNTQLLSAFKLVDGRLYLGMSSPTAYPTSVLDTAYTKQ